MAETGITAYISFILIFLVVSLASRQIGKWFALTKLPLITGFLFAGILAGPYVLNIVTVDAVPRLKFIDELALAFIAFSAGSELIVRQLKSRLKTIRYVTFGLVFATFSVSSIAFYLISEVIPVIKDMPSAHRLGASLLVGAIMTARSPSSAIALVNELRAKGPFTKSVLGVTVIMDVAVIIIFSISGSIAETIIDEGGFDTAFMLVLFSELSLTLLAGFITSYILRFILALHCDRIWKTVLILLTGYGMFAAAGPLWSFTDKYISHGILLEPLLGCMLAGFITANFTAYRTELLKVLHDVAPVVYTAFFTLTGISIQLDVLSQCWTIALALFLFRMAGNFIGAFGGSLAAGEPGKISRVSWMCYITQAGVGLGLAKQVANQFPGWGEVLATLIIAVIVLNQIAGPPFFKWALYKLKEARPKTDGSSTDSVRDAIIFGLEGESLALARLLQSNNWEVKIVTNQVQYSKETANGSDIEIHTVQNLNLATLNKLGIGHADSIVVMLSDEENYKICEMVNEHFGARNFIVRLNNHAYYKRFMELGALIVEPRTAIVNLLDQFVRSPSAARLLLGLEQGREVFELELRNPDLQGVAIRDIKLPLDIHILSIRRNGQLIVSVGFTRLQVGDWLTVVGSRTSLEQIMLQFGESREAELMNLVDVTASRALHSGELVEEVKAIISSGDSARRELFDRLIDECTVLDLPGSTTFDNFFEQASEAVSESLGIPKDHIYNLLIEREEECSTAFRPDLAIPHIIIEGDNVFHLLLARCKDGIYYSELAPKVQAVFVLVGTKDQRDFHLFALASIAEVVQRTYFNERWLNAGSADTLRNIAKIKKN